MNRAKNSTALAAILISSVTLAGGLGAQEGGSGAAMRLVDCVISEGGGPPCPPDVGEAEIDEAIAILAERTGETPEEMRERVLVALDEAVATGDTEAEPAIEAEPEAETAEAADETAAAGEEIGEEAAAPVQDPADETVDPATQPAEQTGELTSDPLDEAEQAAETVDDNAPRPEADAGLAEEDHTAATEIEDANEPAPERGAGPDAQADAQADAQSRSADVPADEASGVEMPGPDASAQEIAAALSGLEDGEERDVLLRRLDEKLAEDAGAALPEDATEAATPDPEERERREQMAEQTSEAALWSQALAVIDEQAGADVDPGSEIVERETEIVTEETARSSDEDVAKAPAASDTQDEDDRDRMLRNVLGAAAAGFVIGQLLDSGDQVVEQAGDRVIVNRDGEYVVLRDENTLLRQPGSTVETDNFADGSSRTIVRREDGTEVVTVRAADGRILYRARLEPDGRRVVLIDERQRVEPVRLDQLPRPEARPLFDYDASSSADELARALRQADRAQALDRRYSLRQVRDIRQLRELMPRIDLDSITFGTGSAAIRPSQARQLSALGAAMAAMVEENPDELFLIEGHTDTVGGEIMNLALSDRRAESVALALTEYYDIPPENMVTQGYGERYLKYPIEGDVRENRRAAVRRITPLLRTAER
jgi:outer membrane protein OmpA-like peptidoglycan-associated protein